MSCLKNYLLNLNIFESSVNNDERENERQVRSNIIATRVLLLVLILVLIILALVFWVRIQMTMVILHNPSEDQFEDLPINAECPCSRMSLSYGEFTSLEATFHQVCSSDFVSDRWIKSINSGSNSTYFYMNDFRTFGSAQFQALAAFCRLSKGNADQNIALFDKSILISPKVLLKSVFQSEIEASIDKFQLTAPTTFEAQLQLIREMTRGNRLISGLQTNMFLTSVQGVGDSRPPLVIEVGYVRENGSACTCRTDIDCVGSSIILDLFGASTQFEYNETKVLMKIDGISSGCLPVNSLLLSTLQCFYNQTCLDRLISFFPTTERFTAMTDLKQSRFRSNSTVKSIVDRLMIEEWIRNVSFEKYYKQCAPISCSYLKVERHHFLFILEKLISFLGGLTLVLKFIVPKLIQFLRRPRNAEHISVCLRLHRLKARMIKSLIELNIFKNNSRSDRQVRYEVYATRIYIILIVISLIILALYSSLNDQIYRKTIKNASEREYRELEEAYPNSISCPCSSISIDYSIFLNIEPHYHQLCSSDFVSSEWLTYTGSYYTSDSSIYSIFDYRSHASAHFQSLRMFCEEAKRMVNDARQIFLQREFVGSEVVSYDLFQSQVNLLIENWKSIILNQFLRTVQLVRATTEGNQLISLENVAFTKNSDTGKVMLLQMSYWNCSCGIDQKCRYPMSIYDRDSDGDISALYSISNFYLGCYPIEALLSSTLECFYNRSCLIQIDKYMYLSLGQFFNFSALNEDLNCPNETIESIVNELMIDWWSSNISFASYYNACASLSCTVEYISRNDLLYVVTTIIGVFGGLSLGFKLIIWISLQLILKISNGFSPRDLMFAIKNVFIGLNEHQIINRLHFLLVLITICVLYVFSAFIPQRISVKIVKPSLSIYEDLIKRYPNSLECPCSHISIKYKSFLDIKYRFHDVCSSDFVSNRWSSYLYTNSYLIYLILPMYFIYSTSGQFQLLTSFCLLSEKIVNDTLLQLLNSDLINSQLLSFNSLDEYTQNTLNQSQTKMISLFNAILSLIRETTGANMIMNAFSSSWTISGESEINVGWSIDTIPQTYEQCNCGLSFKCVKPYNGMHAGCYSLEALFQSTLECLYNQQCIDKSNKFNAMNISLRSSRFNINETIQSIITQLMIEEYSKNISFQNYFIQCAPSSCTYSYTENLNIIKGITYLIALYGGLVIICRSFAVIIIKLLSRRILRINPILE